MMRKRRRRRDSTTELCESEIDAIVDGEEAKIAFNGKYLMDVRGVLREAQVALETTNPSSPGVIPPGRGG